MNPTTRTARAVTVPRSASPVRWTSTTTCAWTPLSSIQTACTIRHRWTTAMHPHRPNLTSRAPMSAGQCVHQGDPGQPDWLAQVCPYAERCKGDKVDIPHIIWDEIAGQTACAGSSFKEFWSGIAASDADCRYSKAACRYARECGTPGSTQSDSQTQDNSKPAPCEISETRPLMYNGETYHSPFKLLKAALNDNDTEFCDSGCQDGVPKCLGHIAMLKHYCLYTCTSP